MAIRSKMIIASAVCGLGVSGLKMNNSQKANKQGLKFTTTKLEPNSSHCFGSREKKFWLIDSEDDKIILKYRNGCLRNVDEKDPAMNGMVKAIRLQHSEGIKIDGQEYHNKIEHLDKSEELIHLLFNFKKEHKKEQYQALKEWLDDIQQKGIKRCERDGAKTYFGKRQASGDSEQ